MKPSVNILISGGGTGGHIYPAIAIANELKKRNANATILFVGAKDRMEMEKVPQAGYQIEGLWISGLQRKLTLKNMLFPIKVLDSLWRANKIIKKFKPNVVIGTGGFASGPTLQMASRRGIPTLVQEQNSYPGITNKLLSKKANTICVAYEGLERFFPKDKIVKTGNPVRQDLLEVLVDRTEAQEYFKVEKSKKTLLVLGGSLGARALNLLLEKNIEWLVEQNVQVLWQSGKLYYQEYKRFNDLKGVKVLEFIDRMDFAYAASDIIISRAGASSISELCIVGKPVIFIPSPNVSEDHQTKNAMAVVSNNAAILLKENELNSFRAEFESLLKDEHKQQELSKNIKQLALPKATEHIANEVEKLINSN
ncbi:undecaprenyldiphospho-muramoylpentapeptide beta-N-acetylglucosaminyltransferase [Aureibaculum marinum]|uniref:UDP-N-acetylglucosamine--N-acetylmuramyl-(pentapeptide) pyrophosphoryl-undecaprenol N-acetylglucosamine transferase n=1 Tax=Aureibaculum marinum TaxID=2487930 RepID=A0A3N4NX23_9FLAO|nr:undecaprenyldiphospho-muramoylpentapeptide beta-N-acetylglucosaminyltransferase [Aureibaculum marinum]RPD91673.1 undecaprenyldiphospho-muramoylpentapeptide beta-N-acetylglucosaminyltransferase [Aureibaculum marinum]